MGEQQTANPAPQPTQPAPSTQPTPSGGGKATVGLVLGIISLIAWLLPLAGLPVSIVGLVLSAKSLKSEKRGLAVAGLVLNIIGLVATIVNASIGAYQGATGQHPFVNQLQK